MKDRDPRNRPYRIATYVVFFVFVVVFCALTAISVIKGLGY